MRQGAALSLIAHQFHRMLWSVMVVTQHIGFLKGFERCWISFRSRLVRL